MPPDRVATFFRLLALPLAAAALTIACAAPAPLAEPELPDPMPASPEPAPQAEPPAAPPSAAPASAAAAEPPAVALLAYADQVRTLAGPAATQELARLSGLAPTAANLLQMAMVLLQTRGPGDVGRAAQLLQRVQSEDSREARALHPLARLLAAHLAEQRKVEEQSERNAQQLRDSQRRVDQLQDRLDALRAIERARPNRPAAP
jgi:hypothetical protein